MILLIKGSEVVGEKLNGAEGREDSLVGSLFFRLYSVFFGSIFQIMLSIVIVVP